MKMAVSLSSTSTSGLWASSAAKKPSNFHHISYPKTLALPIVFTRSQPLQLSISSPILCHYRHGRRVFDCSSSSQLDPNPTVIEGGEDNEEGEETAETGVDNMQESVETLMKLYKEAILAGDSQTVNEIEAAFYRIESENNELVEEISTLSGEIASAREKYIRLQADFDNFRRRSEKERLSVRSDAQGEVIESLLPMLDNFERAKQQIKSETEKEKQIDTSYQGIYKQFLEIMRNLGIAAVETVGKPFDPSLHEAIARGESEEFEEGIVIEEFRRGFLLGDRLLRPAMVKVSAGPGKNIDTKAPQESTEQPIVSDDSSQEEPAAAATAKEH